MKRAVWIAVTVLGAPRAYADATINFFGDVDYEFQSQEKTTNTFQASNLDIFANETEGKFSFIGEMIVEAFQSNEFGIDVDRLEVEYKATPWLRLRAGRIRAAFGYYGDAYQNGKFFMVPVSWPEMYEGNGFDGILPSHAIGLHADTSYSLGEKTGKLTLDAEILNGRGKDLGEVPAFADENNEKAFNFRLRFVGAGDLDGLTVGANAYVDRIPDDTTEGAEHPGMHETIFGAHAAYLAHDLHLIAEANWFRHREDGTQTLHHTVAAFGEAGMTFSDFTPYFRYQYFWFSDSDPYFASSGIETGNHQIYSAGAKYAASASVAFKLEAGLDHDDESIDEYVTAQSAFAF